MRRRPAPFIVSLIFTCVVSTPLLAGTVGLRWQGSTGATGYRVYFGTQADALNRVKDVGATTRATVDELSDCTTWFFAVTAYNAAGESAPSNVIGTWPRPAIDVATPGAAMQGSQFSIEIRGMNFKPGASVEIDNPHVFLGPPSVTCDRVSVAVTVEPTARDFRPAQIGVFDLAVRNPEGPAGTSSFEVLIDPSRFDVNQSDDDTAGRLDGKDTVWLARRFGGREGDGIYDPDFDFNGDGWIDGDELAFLGSNLGGCWTGTLWAAAACMP